MALWDTYVSVTARLLAPIAPHWCEHVWSKYVLPRATPEDALSDTVLTAGWPEDLPCVDRGLAAASQYLEGRISVWRGVMAKLSAAKKNQPKKKVVKLTIKVSGAYTGYRLAVLEVLRGFFVEQGRTWKGDQKDVMKAVMTVGESHPDLADLAPKMRTQKLMMFGKFKMSEAQQVGAPALGESLIFDEAETLRTNAVYISKSLGIEEVVVEAASGEEKEEALPGTPGVEWETVEVEVEVEK